MRVLLACDWFLKYAAAQAAGLARSGVEAALVCRDHALEFAGSGAERRRSLALAAGEGVSVIELPGRLWNPTALPELARARRHISIFGPDIVHVHDKADPRMLGVLPRPVTVLTLHDPEPHPGQPISRIPPKQWLLDTGYRMWHERADAIVVHSTRLLNQVDLAPGQTCAVIPHGIYVKSAPLAPPAQPVIGFFGRLTPYKGLDVLARAMPIVWSVRPDVRVMLAGSGSSVLPLCDPRITAKREYLAEDAVEDFFAGVSLAALPYTQASQTGVGSIAVGYGVPVVASRVGGLPDLTLDTSYTFEANDEMGLARVILAHIDDDLGVRRRVVDEIARPRSWDTVSHQAIELYEGLCAHR